MPEVTVDNVRATLERLAGDADMIWRRGIANAFSRLDRRFRSHDGFKVGARIILERAFNGHGRWNYYYGEQKDALLDIERAFLVLDGGTVSSSYSPAIGAIEASRRNIFDPTQSECETEYFRVRIFKNGNAHLWFRRDDLVEKVNRILANYYGEVIGDARTQEADPLKNRKTTPAKAFGFFPTPAAAADKLLERVPLLQERDKPRLTILEPSAGTGNLARRCVQRVDDHVDRYDTAEKLRATYRFDNAVDCVELQPHLADGLRAEAIYRAVYAQDFLTLTPGTTGLYDRVVMNPPLDLERDIDHVTHALDFLKPDGMLVAIMSAGTEYRETRKATAFRALMERMKAGWDDLPPGSFAAAGTYVNTRILRVWKDGRRFY